LQEFSDDPDYINTFPEHCMQDTKGARFVPATRSKKPYIISWQQHVFDEDAIRNGNNRNIVLYKDKFDIFSGSKHAERVLELLNPDKVVVYGVATNVCVDFAVMGLLQRGKQVVVIEDAIKELPHLPLDETLDKWKKGYKEYKATFTTTKEYISRGR